MTKLGDPNKKQYVKEKSLWVQLLRQEEKI